MDWKKIKIPKGIKMRDPYPSELEYFKANPGVAGMAAEDDKVILNPFTGLKDEEYRAVAINEAARILMRNPKYYPDFDLTDEQSRFLDTTTYRNASSLDRASTIAARVLTGDPSAGVSTSQQDMFVNSIRKALGLGRDE